MSTNPIGELHAQLGEMHRDLAAALDGTPSSQLRVEAAARVRDHLSGLLAEWPQFVAEVYGTPDPDDITPPRHCPSTAISTTGRGGVRVRVEIDLGQD